MLLGKKLRRLVMRKGQPMTAASRALVSETKQTRIRREKIMIEAMQLLLMGKTSAARKLALKYKDLFFRVDKWPKRKRYVGLSG